MTETNSSQLKPDINRLLAYTISSAVGTVAEPKLYGPMRLIDMAERLIRLLDKHGMVDDAELLHIADRIKSGKFLCMDDEAGFISMLDEISEQIAEVIEKEGKK